jgi:hypothetical protein
MYVCHEQGLPCQQGRLSGEEFEGHERLLEKGLKALPEEIKSFHPVLSHGNQDIRESDNP